MKKINWRSKSVVIVLHEATSGLSHDLRDYLLSIGVDKILFIAHPLLYLPENFKKFSRFELYHNGKLIKNHTSHHFVAPEIVLYGKDIIYSIFWSIRYMWNADIYIGIGNVNAFSGLILKSIFGVKNVVYYVIDYVPNRFENKTINALYHFIEKISAQFASVTWNLSPRMIEAREKKWRRKFERQVVVPHGVSFDRIHRVSFDKINKTEILYMGTLLQKQGIQLVISILPQLLKKNKDITFTIIGKGPYEVELRKLVSEYKLEKNVTFLGYIADHHEMEDRLAKAAIAIGLYDKKYDQFSYYADPGKIKNYLGAGVPVIMTDVPYVAREVVKAKCGFIIEYSETELVNVLTKYFTNQHLMKEYRKNALDFAKKYDWNMVFAKALNFVYNAK